MPDTAPRNTIELGGRTYTVERPTGLKASRALAQMRALSRAMPELVQDLAEFRRGYERDNVIELDRVQARMRYPARPLLVDGEPLLEDGRPVFMPSPADTLSEADWQAAGGLFRVPATPSAPEVIAAMLDRALELAEHHVYRLIALFTIPNDELKRLRRAGDGDLERTLDERAEELLDDAYADELLELAVMVGETVDHHFRRKTGELGARMGNALRLVGIDWTPPASPTTSPSSPSARTPSDERPSSSTDSDAPTDGTPTQPSTPPSSSSSSSDDSATSTPPAPNTTSSPAATAAA